MWGSSELTVAMRKSRGARWEDVACCVVTCHDVFGLYFRREGSVQPWLSFYGRALADHRLANGSINHLLEFTPGSWDLISILMRVP